MRKKIIGISVFSFFLFSIFISVAEASCLNPSWTQTVCSSGKIPGVIDDCANITPPWGQGTPNDKCCCDKPVDPSCYWQAESETTAGGQAHWVYCNNQTVLQTGSQISRCANIPKPDPNIYYGCCCSSVLTPQKQQTESKPPLFEAPKLQIGLPTLSLTERVQCTASGDNWECKIPWIGEYVKAIYNYGLGIAGILAAIVLMAGGVVWLVSAGDASRVSLAKELISGSVTGLVILMASYVLLIQINPELVNFKPIKIGAIKPLDVEVDGDFASQISLDKDAISKIFGVACGQASVEEIVQKSKGKVTYSQDNRGKSGPNNTVYLDCSSYANFVLNCSGINSSVPTWTGSIFQEKNIAPEIENLNVGDLIGWPPENGKEGHVLIYMGNKTFADCHGGSGREPGKAIGTGYSLSDIQKSAEKHGNGTLYYRKRTR